MKTKISNVYILLIIIGSFLFSSVHAQITVAPTNLFIDQNSNFGTYMVINNSEITQEISVEFIFGYSGLDSTGSRTFIYDDSLKAEKYSIDKWLRAFPQNFILEPNQRQIVRLRINAPSNLDSGTYWSRIKTRSVPQSPPLELSNESNVNAQIGVIVNQVTGIYYKIHPANTGISVKDIDYELTNNSNLAISAKVERLGNSPFLGSIYFRLKMNNNVVKEKITSTTIFFDSPVNTLIDVSELDKGNYTLELTFKSERGDVPNEDIIQMEPVTATTTVTIP